MSKVIPSQSLPHIVTAPDPTGGAASAAGAVWDLQRIWYGLARRAWARAMLLPTEIAACTSPEAVLALYHRHQLAALQDLFDSSREIGTVAAGRSQPEHLDAGRSRPVQTHAPLKNKMNESRARSDGIG